MSKVLKQLLEKNGNCGGIKCEECPLTIYCSVRVLSFQRRLALVKNMLKINREKKLKRIVK